MLRSKLVKIGIAFAAVFVSFIFALILRHGIVPQTARFKFEKNNSISLITEPSDGIAPVIRLIQGAASSVDLVIYELDDAAVETALINAKRHGIAVRVLLSTGYENASSKVNSGAYTLLQSNGVAVRWTPAYFALTHEKSISIDRRESLIMSFNLVSKYYAADRDFGILDRDARDVSAIEATFDADWQGDAHAQAASGDDLVWSPGSRDALEEIIDNAKTSLLVYNEEMADLAITRALASATRRGVSVNILMTSSTDWTAAFTQLASAGAHIRTYAPDARLYIHAKMIAADGAQAFIGSENFSPTSLDQNRELGIVLSNAAVIQSLAQTFSADWRNATPFTAAKE